MPHITFYHNIEHITPGLNTKFVQLNKQISEKTGIELGHIKSRAVPFTYGAIADRETGKYVHIEVLVKSGKSKETKDSMANIIISFVKEIFDEKNIEEITVELREFEPSNYYKETIVNQN